MSRDSQSERTRTAENSPAIIEDKPAALPDEIWEMIFSYTEYRDVFNLKIVSKHFHAMATRVANIKYKWYLLCQKKVPESQWCDILKLAQHPVNDNINCENFHAESEYPAIWEYLYSTWLEFSRFIDEVPDLVNITGYIVGSDFVRFAGNIIAACNKTSGRIHFYDILKPDAGPIYEIRCPNVLDDFVLSNKGNDLTLIRRSRAENVWIMEHWEVTSQKLMHSERIGPLKTLENQFNCLRICESFGYLCLIKVCGTLQRTADCTVEIRKAASTETLLRSVRIQIESSYISYGAKVHGDTLWVLSYGKFVKAAYKISIREAQLKETCEIPVSTTGTIDSDIVPSSGPYIAVLTERKKITYFASGREWKTYDCNYCNVGFKRISLIVYEGGILALLSTDGRNIKMMKVNPDRLDSELEAMPSRTIRVNTDYVIQAHPCFMKMGFTEYNSEVYFVLATWGEVVVLKCRSLRG